MKQWIGAAGVCLDETKHVLLVKNRDTDAWSLPSGGLEADETPEGCCEREMYEETGYRVDVLKLLDVKRTVTPPYTVETHYFLTHATGHANGPIDPDIAEVAWVGIDRLDDLHHQYPEDIEQIRRWMR